jgi:alkylated DNA repair dioxygenase AlkB
MIQERLLVATSQDRKTTSASLIGRLGQALSGYRPGTTIGWHKDRSVFGDVVDISLLSGCTFRLRKKASSAWQRASVELAPRSACFLRGEVRREWEHSIPAVANLRYSITFRNFRA